MKIAILLMAAGKSTRFRENGAGHKLLAHLNGKPVLQHALESATASGLDVFVITRPEEAHIHALIGEAQIIRCASNGLGESIATAVRACADYDGWLISLADMPLLKSSSYLAAAEALRTSALVRMEVSGVFGHPVGFGREFYDALVNLAGDRGPRALLRSGTVSLISTTDGGCIEDVDTLADLARLESGFSARPGRA